LRCAKGVGGLLACRDTLYLLYENAVRKVGTLNVYGGLDSVMHGLVDLTGRK